ncbi:LacI family DNA-binding transcriptional regulator [Lacticigenium naphthae]|uniref:LacI family DNA-binding transcriptional regulator n=1 Tax=Lacticigenium naphthae TaxID=515351 RepID=UPI000424BD5A|nr:LacI family DNA-binding transcriptional regulator [Lacticigenium naphthae]
MVTIADIAKKAGVAKSTVSRYLNGGSVSPKTKKKIEKIVEETDYRPNSFARSLKASRTNMIGVIIPRLDSPSTNAVLSGIDLKAQKKGFQLIITNANQQEKREIEDIYTLAKQKVDGIIFLAKQITEKHAEAIKKAGIPFLVLGQEAKHIPSIIHDDYGAGQQIAQHALELGHKKFLYFTVSGEDKAVGQERRNGFYSEVSKKENTKVEWVETSFHMNDAYEKALAILKGSEVDATFIACATDNIALAVIKAIHDSGSSVPTDFSVTGFGGYEALSFISPALTTVHYPYFDLGELAIQTMEKMINKKEVALKRTLSNRLIIKETTTKSK